MKIPFLDLVAQGQPLKDDILAMVGDAIDGAGFIGGPNVTGFEADFAAFCETRHCVGVASGTDALRFALQAAGVKAGDEVITVAHTFIATTEAISQVGAKPVFVDIRPDTWNIDFDQIEARITPQTSAIVPVHLYGQPADMDPILEIAEKHSLVVIEDACQAHGARYKGRRAGSIGDIGCFSFYPGKNLGAYGEAGAATTNNSDLAQYMAKIRDHGQKKKYYHDIEGYNGRLDAIQAGVLGIKLKHLQDWNMARRSHGARYRDMLSCLPEVTLPTEAPEMESVYHLFVILVDQRDALQSFLSDKGVATGLHYPQPLHLQEAYRDLGYQQGDFPVTESVAQRLLSLPMYPELMPEQIQYVADCIKQFYNR
ncbi:MAG: DegT/DnrJ/EryC1/StrS family aminotransferase [Deltaproteobacteria bacterium]|nr:DegT/DnrJ/EryC1/StrS family aminotransferase [Deltaproteobacteria bacterium]